MTHIIRVPNVNHALAEGIWHLRIQGKREDSRNGPVLVAPGPVITEYYRPWERVLFCPRRDANHIFHLMEAIWMLAGENDVTWLLQFNSTFGKYAEEDNTMHGAYGHRWRKYFDLDQIKSAFFKLRDDPTTRQVVIAMWDPTADLEGAWKDRPCNTHIYFDLRGDRLNMMVNCRSNDILWGAYGSNVVHFSMLQELLANALGVHMGAYYQNSFNYHMYMDLPLANKYVNAPPKAGEYDEYQRGKLEPTRLLYRDETIYEFLDDCCKLVNGRTDFNTFFFLAVAFPLSKVYLARKAGAPANFNGVPNCDWRVAFEQWIERRKV